MSGLCKQFLQARDVMKSMAGMSMGDRMKFGSQFAQMSMAGQMPQVKGKGRTKYKPAKRDKRKQRKRKSR